MSSMNRSTTNSLYGPVAAVALALGLLLGAGGAQANRPVGAQIAGTVTAVTANSITVNGTTYTINPNSPAAAELRQVSVGQSVSLQLTGAAGSSASQVVSVQPAANGPGTSSKPPAGKR
jgi:hypothetical protein